MRIMGIALAFVLFSGLWANGQKEAAAPKELTIGYLGAMTGNLANYGTLQAQSVKLAHAEFIRDNPDVPVKLVVEDTAGRSDRSAQAVDKMISVDRISALIGPVISSVALAIAPRLQQAQVVTISGSASAPDFTKAGDYIFRTQVSDAIQADVMGRYVFQELGIKKVAVLYTENDYSQPLGQRFKEVFEAAGGEVVAMESSLEGDKDFKGQLTKIRGAQPEGLFLPNYAVELAQILRQANQLGLEAQMLSADGFSQPDTLALAGKAALDVIYSGPALSDLGVDEQKRLDFVSRYQAEFGVEPDAFSQNTFDAAQVILESMAELYRQEGKVERAKLRDMIATQRDYPGVSGVINFDMQGDVIKNQAILTTVPGTDGMPVYQQQGLFTVVNGTLKKVG